MMDLSYKIQFGFTYVTYRVDQNVTKLHHGTRSPTEIREPYSSLT